VVTAESRTVMRFLTIGYRVTAKSPLLPFREIALFITEKMCPKNMGMYIGKCGNCGNAVTFSKMEYHQQR
jgi:hypothetical protein